MKISTLLKSMVLASGVMLTGSVLAEGAPDMKDIGEKIYSRAFGRGCATCHDVQPNPNLFESVNKLSKEEFTAVLKNGRNAMPKAMEVIMGMGPVKTANLTEDQAVDALIQYLKAGKK
jgi:cytochrome c551